MNIYLILIVVELIGLYILSRRLTQNLFVTAFLLTKSRPVSVGFLSFLFFPGTVVHELAHLFVAEILGVRTSGLTLTPEAIEEKDVRTGSVAIAQTDPIRRAIIGIAPVFVGLILIAAISYFLPALWFQAQAEAQAGMLLTTIPFYLLLFSVYSLFAVSNTMFSSPEDLNGFWPVVIVVTLLIASLYIIGVRITLTDQMIMSITQFLLSISMNLAYVVGLNIVLFIASKAMIRVSEQITGRRLVPPAA
jgi:hypothetical protein